MQNANIIFTRTRFGLDTRIWLMMLLLLFFSLFLLGFKMATRVVCSDYSITPIAITAGKANSFYTGEPIVFSDSAVLSGDNIVWDFDDGSKPTSGNRIKHFFLHDGNYTVTSTVNGSCVQTLIINIKEFASKTPVVITPVSIENIITGADTPHVGEKAIYAATQKAGKYEWSVLNAPEYPTITDSIASWKFEIPGSRIVVLKINGDDKKIFKKNIVVMQPLPQKTSSSAATAHTMPPLPLNLPPRINSITPASGSTGTTITIIGSNFSSVTAVSFGGTPAASFVLLSPTTISATIGAGASGNVSVTTRNGVAILPTQIFTYSAPATASTSTTLPPPKTKILMIPDEEFKHMFQKVCDGEMDASGFNAYLCKGDGTKVLANNEWTSLGEFCKKLKEKKKAILGRKEYKINSVKVTRDAASQNCVTNLTVDYK